VARPALRVRCREKPRHRSVGNPPAPGYPQGGTRVFRRPPCRSILGAARIPGVGSGAIGTTSRQGVPAARAPDERAVTEGRSFLTAVHAVQVRTPHRSPSRVAVLSVEAKAPSPVQGAGAALCALSRRRRADGVKPFVHRSGPNRCHLDLLRTAAAIIATRILLWLQKPPFPASGRVRKAEPARSMICPLQRGDKAS